MAEQPSARMAEQERTFLHSLFYGPDQILPQYMYGPWAWYGAFECWNVLRLQLDKNQSYSMAIKALRKKQELDRLDILVIDNTWFKAKNLVEMSGTDTGNNMSEFLQRNVIDASTVKYHSLKMIKVKGTDKEPFLEIHDAAVFLFNLTKKDD